MSSLEKELARAEATAKAARDKARELRRKQRAAAAKKADADALALGRALLVAVGHDAAAARRVIEGAAAESDPTHDIERDSTIDLGDGTEVASWSADDPRSNPEGA